MKKKQIILYKKPLKNFLQVLRRVIWCSIAFSGALFLLATLFWYKQMLISAMLTATAAFLSFHLLQKYSVIITKKWFQSRGGQEEVLVFLDEEMNGRSARDFFQRLEQALKIIDDKA